MLGLMSSAGATVLAAVIGAAAVIISVVVSLFVARASATAAVKTAQASATAAVEAARASATAAVQTKLDELKQAQITSIIQQRIDRYPSLWILCQESITLPAFWPSHFEVPDGWASALSAALEDWHNKHGIFLSQTSYTALFHLRRKARYFADNADHGGTRARGPLNELSGIWSQGFKDDKGVSHTNLAASMKNDLGSYIQAALSL